MIGKSKATMNEEASNESIVQSKRILLSESTYECLPAHLLQLTQFYDINSLSQAHAVFLCVYVLAVEEGYIPLEFFKQQKDTYCAVPSYSIYHQQNVNRCCAHKPTYKCDPPNETFFSDKFQLNVDVHSEMAEKLSVTLTALVSGEYLVVTLTPDAVTHLQGDSVCLSITRYVVSKPTSNKPLSHCFRNLNQLSVHLRNELFTPVRNKQLEFAAAAPYPGIMGLPQELRFAIYKKLNEVDLRHMAVTCKEIKGEVVKRIEILKKKKLQQEI